MLRPAQGPWTRRRNRRNRTGEEPDHMTQDSLDGVFAVPPLARAPGKTRTIDFEQNSRIVRHIAKGGVSRFIYGGNAFLYHLSLDEYEQLLEWRAEIERD